MTYLPASNSTAEFANRPFRVGGTSHTIDPAAELRRVQELQSRWGFSDWGDIGHPASVAAVMMGGSLGAAMGGGGAGAGAKEGGNFFSKMFGGGGDWKKYAKLAQGGFNFGGNQQPQMARRPVYSGSQATGAFVSPAEGPALTTRRQMLADMMRRV